GLSDEALEAWRDIDRNNPLRFRSRFASVRVAHLDVSPTVHEVLQELRDGGTSNVLLVPAAFCASSDEMRTLRGIVTGHTDGMTVHWLPGLGGTVYRRHEVPKTNSGHTPEESEEKDL
ncbi:MAG: hypothetical protein KDC38_12975, partial [Planctomycetes bacterium]|nr:hypothetical protein [Planctomycetota bacterium]